MRGVRRGSFELRGQYSRGRVESSVTVIVMTTRSNMIGPVLCLLALSPRRFGKYFDHQVSYSRIMSEMRFVMRRAFHVLCVKFKKAPG